MLLSYFETRPQCVHYVDLPKGECTEAEFWDVIGTSFPPPCASHSHVYANGFYSPPPPLNKPVCNLNNGNLKPENSKDYAQKTQQNCTFMNSVSGEIYFSSEGERKGWDSRPVELADWFVAQFYLIPGSLLDRFLNTFLLRKTSAYQQVSSSSLLIYFIFYIKYNINYGKYSDNSWRYMKIKYIIIYRLLFSRFAVSFLFAFLSVSFYLQILK